jgi:tetratricopeptide (TPR) repeat protein
LNRKSTILLMTGVLSLVGMAGCGVFDNLRAKNSLNEGVRAFNGGKYEVAQTRFSEALALDPKNAKTQLFYARALNAKFEQKQTEEAGLQALEAYENIINHGQGDPKTIDQSLAFEAKVYDDLSTLVPDKAVQYKDKERATLLRRADLPGATDQIKAEVYYTIGEGYWKESYDLSRPYLQVVGGKAEQKAIPQPVADKMKPAILKAHEYLQKALAVQPDYADAWIYEKLVYLEETKVEPAKKQDLDKKMTEAQDNYKKYHDQQQAQAQQAQASPQ